MEGAFKNHPHPLLGTAPPPQRRFENAGRFQDGRLAVVFMKTIGPNKNQLIIKIDQDTTYAGGMADDLAGGYGLADDSIVL